MLTGLAGLRWLAALIVIYYHLNQHRTTVGLSERSWDIYQFTEHLVFVVSVFFIFSGFFRALTYWKKIEKNERIPQFFPSLKERFFRIAPLYYLALTSTLIYVAFTSDITWETIIRFFSWILFLNWISPITFFPVDHNGPLWFVAYDMLGWILISLFMMLVAKFWKKYFFCLFVIIFGFLIASHYAWISIPWSHTEWIVGEWFPTYNPFLFGLHFMLWVLGAYIVTHIKQKNIFYDAFSIGIISLLGYILWDIRASDDWSYSWPVWPYHFPLVPLLIMGLVVALPFTRYIGRLLDNPILVFYSRISYSLYLFHALVIVILRQYLFTWVYLEFHTWIFFSWIVVLISTLLSYWLMRWYEPIFDQKESK